METTWRTSTWRPFVPYFVLAATAFLTLAASYIESRAVDERDHARFEASVQRALAAIEKRMDTYVGLLSAGSGLFAANGMVTHDQFRAFVDRLDLERRYVGIQGIGYARLTRAGDRDRFIQAMRQSGVSDYDIWPEGERDTYLAIAFLEPPDRRNRAAIGYDMGSEPVRRAAMERAGDSGSPAASGKVTLVQEIDERRQPGFLIYVPIYQSGEVPDSVEARRRLLQGFVYSPFRAADLFSAMFGVSERLGVEFAVYDGREPGPENLLYSSRAASDTSDSSRLTTRTEIEVAGRTWTVEFVDLPGEDPARRPEIAGLILVGGFLVSLALFGVTRAEVRARQVAEQAVSDLSASQIALKESESRYRYLFENSPLPMWVYDAETLRFLAVNDAAVAQYGYSKEEFAGLSLLDVRPDEDRAAAEVLIRSLGPGLETSAARRHRRKDGTLVEVDVTSHSLTFDGRPARLALVNDVTERNRAERALRRAHADLEAKVAERTAELSRVVGELRAEVAERRRAEDQVRLSQQELREYIDHMSTLNAKIALDGTILLVNRMAQIASGSSRDEMVGRSFVDGRWWTFDPEVHARVQGAFQRAVRGETVNYEEQIFVWGKILTISFSLTPVCDERGAVQYVLAEGRDITPLKQAQDALRQSTAQLESVNRELEAFSYSVSHDLRAPLRSIDGFSKAVLEDYADRLDEEGRRYLDRVRAAAGRMGQLIDDLLALSRVTRSELIRESVDLTATARVVAEQLRRTDQDRAVEFAIQDGVTAQGDPRLLRIVLENLLANAWKFTSRKPSATIEFGTVDVDGERAYFVRDNGAGLDMAYASKLFTPFQRLHDSSQYEGTGIGLATVQRIIRRHGGRVWADGQVDIGATFYFTLG